MKPVILLLLLSFIAAAAEAQQVRRPGPQATVHRQQLHGTQATLRRHQLQARPPAFRQPIIVQRRGGSCGIGRWVDGVFTCQAGPVERALDRLNYTIGNNYSAIQIQQSAIQSAAEANAQAQLEAANKAASDAAYNRSTIVFPPPAGLGPIPDEKIYKRVGPNGIVTYSNVQ